MKYSELLTNLKFLRKGYDVKVIGKTKFDRKIIAVERILDNSFSTAIFVAGVHARENIATDMLFEMIQSGMFDNIKSFNLSFILMANPDGVAIESGELDSFPKEHRDWLENINGSSDFSMWKANAFGVDINNNFDARFNTNVHALSPASQGFPGQRAMSENETIAIANYTRQRNAFFTISYHTKGEEIYYNFFQSGKRLIRDKIIAERFQKSTGYKIVNVERGSSGGYKDWCVQKLKIPALTIELGSDDWSHPIGREHLAEIFERNKTIASDAEFAYNVFGRNRDEL